MPTGEVLVGRGRGFDIVSSDGRIVKSVSVSTGNIISIQFYNNEIYTLCIEPPPSTKRYVIVFNRDHFNELRRWSVPDYKFISNIAVSNYKVYVSDTDNKRIRVYSLTGAHINFVNSSTFNSPVHLSVGSGCSVIISDYWADKVHKLDSRTDTITWTCPDVRDPTGVCCDTNGDVWVWSDSTKSIYVLSSATGKTTVILLILLFIIQ